MKALCRSRRLCDANRPGLLLEAIGLHVPSRPRPGDCSQLGCWTICARHVLERRQQARAIGDAARLGLTVEVYMGLWDYCNSRSVGLDSDYSTVPATSMLCGHLWRDYRLRGAVVDGGARLWLTRFQSVVLGAFAA